jgi:hypothetical protein
MEGLDKAGRASAPPASCKIWRRVVFMFMTIP